MILFTTLHGKQIRLNLNTILAYEATVENGEVCTRLYLKNSEQIVLEESIVDFKNKLKVVKRSENIMVG